ncbi:hypothetical protein TorRG33x02_181280, partial [Trema orientale]
IDSKIIIFLYFSLLASVSSLPLLHAASPTSASSSLIVESPTEYYDIPSLRPLMGTTFYFEIFEDFSVFKFIN